MQILWIVMYNPPFSQSRYEVDGICALNFILEQSLGGGGVASLRSDPQGKAYGQMLLDFVINDMPDICSIRHQWEIFQLSWYRMRNVKIEVEKVRFEWKEGLSLLVGSIFSFYPVKRFFVQWPSCLICTNWDVEIGNSNRVKLGFHCKAKVCNGTREGSIQIRLLI